MFHAPFHFRGTRPARLRTLNLVWVLLSSLLCRAQDGVHTDLTQLSLEQLARLEVTSVSKKKQKLEDVAAAVFVITQQDIQGSGARNIPDLLRMAPGVDVAQITAHTWAISIRGFGDLFTDKVLVLIDGRSVYSPTTSGVYWDQQEVPLEDIDRIEVIRGPGGTVWGANAVNGVINIITKDAKDTQGGLITTGAGSNESADGLIQYGGKIRETGSYRVYGSYSNVGSLTLADGAEAADGWHTSHAGFRSDWKLSARDTMTVQGDLLQTSAGENVDLILSNALQEAAFTSRATVGAGNILERWNRTLSEHSDISLQAYYDGYSRHEQGDSERRATFDLDFQHHFTAGARHDIVWGLGYRVTGDDITPGFRSVYLPPQRTDNLFSGFLQDELRLANTLWLTLGSKLEHNAYTGFEYEPSAQLMWKPTTRQAVWLSVARAIRQPARADADLQADVAVFPLDNGETGVVRLIGDPDRDRHAENLISYQLGYRTQISSRFSFDTAGFLNFYHRLQTQEPLPPFVDANPIPHVVFPQFFDDQAHARTCGGEIFVNWKVTSRWRISPGYAYLSMNVARDPSSQDTSVAGIAGDTPKHKFEIRSLMGLTHHLNWDVALYHVNRLPDLEVRGYDRLDTRLAWQAGERTELSLVGQNLLTPRHQEFGDAFFLVHSEAKRSVYGKVAWRF